MTESFRNSEAEQVFDVAEQIKTKFKDARFHVAFLVMMGIALFSSNQGNAQTVGDRLPVQPQTELNTPDPLVVEGNRIIDSAKSAGEMEAAILRVGDMIKNRVADNLGIRDENTAVASVANTSSAGIGGGNK